MRLAPEGIPVVLAVLLLAAAGFAISATWGSGIASGMGSAAVLVALGLLWFFRDPERCPPSGDDLVVAPADGRVIEAGKLDDGRWHVAIFLSILNVHVNRVPASGTVESVVSHKGSYRPAFTAHAADKNARIDVVSRTPHGMVSWRQVSGLLARRLSCRIQRGDDVTCGERFGIIYFGSRMDVFMPPASELAIKRGACVRAGETVIGHLRRMEDEA
ncbi:phosphatidylserine decarboxylase [bacterium]|nr:phosphatidylserine decarboxylase [bacterium]MBU1983396.1 phosphatidylserine decarboxylase [bacterium]